MGIPLLQWDFFSYEEEFKKVIRELRAEGKRIDSGFEVLIVSVKDGLRGKEWLGRRIDEEFIGDLGKLNVSIDPCGENGEFHTLVTDGLVFRKKIVITQSKRVLREGYWSVNISGFTLREK